VIIALYTGLRFKDVCFLKWSNVDFKKNLIELKPAKTERFSRKVQIPIHPALKRELGKIKQTSDHVLPHMAENYHKRGFQAEFAEILSKAKVKDSSKGNVGFHSLRHTFVTILEESGAARHASQKLVGHGSPVMTETYSHDLKTATEAVNKLPDLLE
jgi:integrase